MKPNETLADDAAYRFQTMQGSRNIGADCSLSSVTTGYRGTTMPSTRSKRLHDSEMLLARIARPRVCATTLCY
jgi:hypothetical protein